MNTDSNVACDRRRQIGAAILGTLLGQILLACSDSGASGAPGWVPLARTGETIELPLTAEYGRVAGRTVRFVEEDGDIWLESVLTPADWEWDEKSGGVWRAPVFVRGRGQPMDGSHGERVLTRRREFQHRTRGEIKETGELPVGHFHIAREKFEVKLQPGTLLLRLKANQKPPAETLVRMFAAPEPEGGFIRVSGRRFSGIALPVWPGQSLEEQVDIPPGRALRFATTVEPAVALPASQHGALTFSVSLNGRRIFEHTVADNLADDVAWHTVELPGGGADGGRLRFEVEGALAHTAFQMPVIGPADVGTYGARPWGDTRPDIVVFLADTFRADNLGAFGNELGLTPNLDRLAQASLFFERAWSVATFTMPAHATMFSGLYARQSGATSTISALPDGVTTVAEWLGEHGYRTGAITDSVVVSQKNNLDQGFDFFDEHHGTLEETTARAHEFLDADDGRPVFLFVQSYRTHTPYAVSRETAKEFGRALGLETSFNKISKALRTLGKKLDLDEVDDLRRSTKEFYRVLYENPAAEPADVAEYERLIALLRGLYLGAVADLDRGFARFHDGLGQRGLLDSGFLFFTSDHGEAFNEHGKVFHGGKVWNELTHIPLMITGPGVDARVEERAASLIDFAPTIAAMARIRPAPGWIGNSLLDLKRDRPVFAFENQKHQRSTLHVIEGARKVMAYENAEQVDAGAIFAAFDLAADPLEQNDVAQEADWPAELIGRLGDVAELLLIPLHGEAAGYVGSEREAELRALGYTGDDD